MLSKKGNDVAITDQDRSRADAMIGADRVVIRTRARLAGRLPTGRAVVGGLLVTLAAAGVLVAHRSASQPPTTRYVVATRAVAAGATVGTDDLGTIAIELPGEISAVPSSEASDLIGRVAATALEPLELVRPGDVLSAGRFTDPESVEVSLELPPARALEGIIRTGSRVDVLVTDPDGDSTSVLATGVRVTSTGSEAEGGGGGIGDSGSIRVLLSVSDSAQATALVDASLRSDITLVLPRPSGDAT